MAKNKPLHGLLVLLSTMTCPFRNSMIKSPCEVTFLVGFITEQLFQPYLFYKKENLYFIPRQFSFVDS